MNEEILENKDISQVQGDATPLQISLEIIYEVLRFLSGLASTWSMPIVPVH